MNISCYAACRGGGQPLVNATGGLDATIISGLANFPRITMNATPWVSPYMAPRTDALMALRKANPKIKIGLYGVLGWFWADRLPAGFISSHRTFDDAIHDICREEGAFFPNGNVNVAKAEARLTKLWCDAVSLGLHDFALLDFCSANTSDSTGAINRLVNAVREAGGPGFHVIGNGWTTGACDGEFSEWTSFGPAEFERVRLWRQARPHMKHDWLQVGHGLTALDPQLARFAIALGLLFDCHVSVGPDRDLPNPPPAGWTYYGTWDVVGQVPQLGDPIGPARLDQGVWKRDFSRGSVAVTVSQGDAQFVRR